MGVVSRVFEAAERDDLDAVKMYIETGKVRSTIKMKYPFILRRYSLAHIAARNGNLKMLEYLVQKDSSILIEERERTPLNSDLTILAEAVKKGALNMVKYLVEKHNANIFEEAYPHFRDEPNTPVKMAICQGNLDVTKYFVEERKVNVDQPCETGRSYCWISALLFEAINCKKRDIMEYLIEERKADLTVIDDKGENVLFKAVRQEEALGIKFMKYVLDKKEAQIDINWRNKKGETVLWLAVKRLLIVEIEYLIHEKHADVNIPDKEYQQTPLHLVLEKFPYSDEKVLKYLNLVHQLVDHGANLNQKDTYGDTPLHLAASRSYITGELCKYIIEHNGDVTQRNKEGVTPLDIAIFDDNQEVWKCFIEQGVVDINRKDENGETILHVAAICNRISLLEYLVGEKHADVNAMRTADHWTPLHCAAFWNNSDSCEYLIKHGANPLAKGTFGKTPAQVAPDKRLINLIQNVSRTTRTRRDVRRFSQLSPFLLHATPYNHKYLGIAGNLDKIISADNAQVRMFQFQNFLLFARWFLRYLLRGSLSARNSLQAEPQSVRFGEVIQDPVAEAAVSTLPQFEEN